jgi:hypothetical protein
MRVMRFLLNMCLVILSCPNLLGRPGAKGAALQANEDSFSEGPEQIVCAFAKGGAGNLRGKPKPTGAGTAERSRRARELPCSQAQQWRAERQTRTQRESQVLRMDMQDGASLAELLGDCQPGRKA